jgi:chromosome partitioning protein
MTPPVLAFFNNKGGVGKTMLAYHIAWMLNELGKSVVVLDLDPQANLTASFLDDERVEQLWAEPTRRTVYGALAPHFEGEGGIGEPHVEEIAPNSGWYLVICCFPGRSRNSASRGPAAWTANSAPSG